MEQPPTGRPRHACFLAGSIVLLLTAVAHTIGQLQDPPPASEDEATMLRLMRSVSFEMLGTKRTFMQILDGFSWFFNAALVFMTVLGVALWWTRRSDRGLVRLVAGIYAFFLLGVTGLSAAQFPPPPTMFLGVAALLFLISAATA